MIMLDEGLSWVLTPADIDLQRLREAVGLTDEDIYELQDAMERIRVAARAAQ